MTFVLVWLRRIVGQSLVNNGCAARLMIVTAFNIFTVYLAIAHVTSATKHVKEGMSFWEGSLPDFSGFSFGPI